MPTDDGASEPYRTDHDWRSARSLSRSVIETVSRATGTDPDRMRPLYQVIAPDALDRLFEPTDRRSEGAPHAVVAFRFEGCAVTVDGDGHITARPADGDRS